MMSSIVHAGCTIGPHSTCESILVMDKGTISGNCKVTHSVIGPDGGIGGGECLHSLVGPFTGMHHQSLLIASIWPLGRGNIAYGAMVG